MEQTDLVIETLSKACGHKVPKVALAASKCLALRNNSGVGREALELDEVFRWGRRSDWASRREGEKRRQESYSGMREMDRGSSRDGEDERQVAENDERRGGDAVGKRRGEGKEKVKATRFLVSVQKAMRVKTTSSDNVREDVVCEETEAEAGAKDYSSNEDPYDSAEPFSVLKALDKPSMDEDIPKFWEAAVSSNWRHRLHALKQLTDACSSSARLQKEDFMELQKVLKNVILKDANANCVAEASKSIMNLCLNARADFSKEAKMLLGALLDKLKDKNAFVTNAIANALDAISLRCFAFCDSAEDVVKYGLRHKVGKAKLETLKWLTRSSASFSLQEAKKTIGANELVATVVKLLEDKDPETKRLPKSFSAHSRGEPAG